MSDSIELLSRDDLLYSAKKFRTRAELMAPVVEAARCWYANGVDPDQRYWTALCRAIEDYEERTDGD